MWSVLSVVATWHGARTQLTRHSKIMIHLSCMGIESQRILGFVSDHTRLSTLWSCSSWPYYSCLRSHENWGFQCWSSHASLPVYFRLSVQAVRCCSHLARPCEVFDSWGKDVVCTKMKQMQQSYFFIIWNVYEYIMQPHEPMQQATDKIVQKNYLHIKRS
jgi:hypothetical protein